MGEYLGIAIEHRDKNIFVCDTERVDDGLFDLFDCPCFVRTLAGDLAGEVLRMSGDQKCKEVARKFLFEALGDILGRFSGAIFGCKDNDKLVERIGAFDKRIKRLLDNLVRLLIEGEDQNMVDLLPR